MSSKRSGGIPATFSLVIVSVVVVLAIVLLWRVQSNAATINGEAASIAKTGKGINSDTDSVIQLNHTNDLAKQILASAQPLQGELAHIISLAGAADGTAKSINNTAGTINNSARSISGSAGQIGSDASSISNSAGAINSTAHGINTTASSILDVANSISHGVDLINSNLDVTISVANQILGDAGNIITQANIANHEAACIDKALNTSVSGC